MTRDRGTPVAWVIAVVYALAYSVLGIARYRSYHASCDDGLFTQAIAASMHGMFNTPEGVSHFAFHFSPILYALAPLIWLTRSAEALVVMAAIAGALTVPPIYAIARRRMNAAPALAVAAIAALYPALGGIAFTDFSENVFAPAAAAWLVWAIDTRRLPAATVFAIVCLAIKEDQALIMCALGIVGAIYFSRRGEQRWATFCLSLAVVSIATLAAFMAVVRPATHVWFPYPSIRDFYAGSPLAVAGGISSAQKAGYIFAILLPLLGICLLSRAIVLAIPGLLECLASRVPLTFMVGQHYAAVWIPYVLVAFALGIARLYRWSPLVASVALAASLGVSLYVNVWASPNDWNANISPRTASMDELDRLSASLPQDAGITAFCQVFAHLGMHPGATTYATSPTRFVVLFPDRDDPSWDTRERAYMAKSYRLVRSAGSVELYER